MTPAAAKRLRLLVSVLSLLVLVALAAGGWFYARLRASLPQLDGPVKISGLTAPVTVDRDALGVPTIRAQNRLDAARALGWLHGQERFFQMDLLRRRSAGELAELVGPAALPLDRSVRLHGFRALAEKITAGFSAGHRALLEAYAAGVNAGRGALREKPFEYLVLRTDPQPWQPEDSMLVNFSMWLDLQDDKGRYEHTLMTIRDQFGAEALAFFAPLLTPGDAALDGTTAPAAPPPGPKIIDLRKRPKLSATSPARPRDEFFTDAMRDGAAGIGSNAFALAGSHTANGAAVVANDMHLNLAVPNIWYRASLEFSESAPAAGEKIARKITGVTLPGTPLVIAGSNGHVAWGFTDAYADTGDLVVVDIVPGSHSVYNAPGHDVPLEIEVRKETIRVKGKDPIVIDCPWTIWGPVVGENEKHLPLAYRWIAHDPAAVNLGLIELEDATDVKTAVDIAHRAGVPELNFVVADSAGQIAWTIAGALPKRVGYDGRLPTNWSFGDRRWDGLLRPEDVPSVVAPAAGRLWSGNQRAVGGAGLAAIGDGGYARSARAAQIRDDLASLEHAAPRDLLGVQLDDRALFLAPWQKLLVDTLTPAVVAQKNSRAELRALAAKWDGHASVDSVSYRLVRAFRTAVRSRLWTPIFQSCVDVDEGFDWNRLDLEPATWTLLRERPAHLLNPEFDSWDAVLTAAADDVVTGLEKQHVPLARATWGARNTTHIIHPLARALPAWLTGWLNLPAEPVPGDNDMPRVVAPSFGASERFVVSPGHEAEGIFEMPGGQSGHPLSPFFRAGHEAWVRGEPTPFLPGPAVHTLILQP